MLTFIETTTLLASEVDDQSWIRKEIFYNAEANQFKDESEGLLITEMIFLRAKMYAYMKVPNPDKGIPIPDNYKEMTMKAKGVSKGAMNDIRFEQYKACIFRLSMEDTRQHVTSHHMRSKKHIVRILQQRKVSLSHYDDKRFYLDSVTSRAHFHYRNL